VGQLFFENILMKYTKTNGKQIMAHAYQERLTEKYLFIDFNRKSRCLIWLHTGSTFKVCNLHSHFPTL
jgi:hypothetical protein